MRASKVGRIRSTFVSLFRNRKTGAITVVQFPNFSLGIFLTGSLVRRLVHLNGTARILLEVLLAVSLSWWALDEIVRGVNPWRRFLGAAVLTAFVVSLA